MPPVPVLPLASSAMRTILELCEDCRRHHVEYSISETPEQLQQKLQTAHASAGAQRQRTVNGRRKKNSPGKIRIKKHEGCAKRTRVPTCIVLLFGASKSENIQIAIFFGRLKPLFLRFWRVVRGSGGPLGSSRRSAPRVNCQLLIGFRPPKEGGGTVIYRSNPPAPGRLTPSKPVP